MNITMIVILIFILRECPIMESSELKKTRGNSSRNNTSSRPTPSKFRTNVDLQTEERLRERWNQFMSERTKQVEFVSALSSPSQIYVIRDKDLYISCGLNRPLNGRLKISFMRLSSFSLLSVGTKLHTPDPRVEVINNESKVWTIRVRNVGAEDSGVYECILNTEPSIRESFKVTVIESHVHIVPSEPGKFELLMGLSIYVLNHLNSLNFEWLEYPDRHVPANLMD